MIRPGGFSTRPLPMCRAIDCEKHVWHGYLGLCASHAAMLPHNIRAACWNAYRIYMGSGSQECLDVLEISRLTAVLELAAIEGKMTRDAAEGQLRAERLRVMKEAMA